MHEVSVIQEIVDIVIKETASYSNSEVKSVILKIGKLRQFVPEIMKFCYEVAAKGTRLENSELHLIEVPINIQCKKCGITTMLDEFDFHCPHCFSIEIDTLSGNELILESIQLNEPVAKDEISSGSISEVSNGT